MDQLDHVTSGISITVFKVIRKIITEMDLWYQTDVNRRAKKVCLVAKIHFYYYFSKNLNYSNFNFWRHVVQLTHDLKRLKVSKAYNSRYEI